MRDMATTIGGIAAIAPAVLSATTTSPAIDLRGFNSATVFLNTGAIVSAGDFTAKLQESDTDQGGDFTDVAAANMIGAFPASLLAASLVKIGYIGPKRFVRLVTTKNGGTSIAAGATIILGNSRTAPVS